MAVKVLGLMQLLLNRRVNIPFPHLPRAHYKEYLVSLINAHSLDPATLYEVEELETATVRYLHVPPQPMDGEDLPAYKARLLQVMLSHPALELCSYLPEVTASPGLPVIVLSPLQTLTEEVPLGQSIPRRRK